MAVLCVLVGSVLQFFRKGDAETRNSFISHRMRGGGFDSVEMTDLAVLTGLGSKWPCASTDPCFSRLAAKLVSTKSGGSAPAMAHRQDLAILKSSASYFYTFRGQTDRRGHTADSSSDEGVRRTKH